jgi:transcriptional regulator with XRE-family HTH domain
MSTFAGQVRKQREKLGITQADLARMLHTDPSHVAHYESGRREPTFGNACLLAKALGVSMDYLAGHETADYDAGFRAGYFEAREDMKKATRAKLGA